MLTHPQIGLQTISYLLVNSFTSVNAPPPRAMIITTLSASTLLPILRDILKTEISLTQPLITDTNGHLRECLKQISISRVFDVNGLWEVLGELDLPTQPQDPGSPMSPQSRRQTEKTQQHDAGIDEELPPSAGETEIMDSQDEGGLSPESSGETSANLAAPEREPSVHSKQANVLPDRGEIPISPVPDIILITHMSSLLTTLFTHREKATAHTTLQLIASHMRYLTRSPENSGPLLLILNSTTSSAASTDNISATTAANTGGSPPRPPSRPHPPSKPLDPTLRSVFNPPPQSYGYDAPPTRRNKPSFGLVFTQLLDVHLLCTRVPKRRADAEALYAPPRGEDADDMVPSAARQIEYATVVEVLLDEVGAWEVGGQGQRRSREQRWGAVQVWRAGEGGMVRVVDAFETPARQPGGDVRLAAGFGGRIDR